TQNVCTDINVMYESFISMLTCIISFFFYSSGHHLCLHSFPTRRSSDLGRHGRYLPRRAICARRRAGSAADEPPAQGDLDAARHPDRKSTRLNSSHSQISYAVFCLKKKSTIKDQTTIKRSPIGLLAHMHD